jgi:hypothetical protein
LRTSLPHATRVLDAFHVTRLGFAAVDDARRRVQQDSTGHRGRKHDTLYGIRRVLRRGHEHLTDVAWDRLLTGLDVGDVDGQVAAAWIVPHPSGDHLPELVPRRSAEQSSQSGAARLSARRPRHRHPL